MKKLSLFLFGALFLLGCNSAPMFGETEGQTMSQDFFALMKTDPESAYQETSIAFQEVTSERDFVNFSEGDLVQHLTAVTVQGISEKSSAYDSDYSGPAAIITLSGDASFDDGSSGLISVQWFYAFDQKAWEINSFEFKPKP